MADFLSIDLEDEGEIFARIERVEEGQRRRARQMLDNLADFAVFVLRANVPVRTSYLLRHVARTPVVWRPGGAGGGGEWEVVAGVKRGLSRHPLYVEFGTGLYGAVGWYIVPNRAPFMVFRSSITRRIIRATRVRGQRPQRYFYRSWRELEIYARGRVLASAMDI
jgi:hypothetical protein